MSHSSVPPRDTLGISGALRGLPPGTAVTFDRDVLLDVLSEAIPAPEERIDVDLSVQQVADRFGRSANTVRRWITNSQLRAYKLQGREYRVGRAAIAEFQERQREGPPNGQNGTVASLGAWRAVRSA